MNCPVSRGFDAAEGCEHKKTPFGLKGVLGIDPKINVVRHRTQASLACLLFELQHPAFLALFASASATSVTAAPQHAGFAFSALATSDFAQSLAFATSVDAQAFAQSSAFATSVFAHAFAQSPALATSVFAQALALATSVDAQSPAFATLVEAHFSALATSVTLAAEQPSALATLLASQALAVAAEIANAATAIKRAEGLIRVSFIW
ncbi:MAG: hypothetical protein ABQ298_12455 [Puniceicoccaceae bacterium]